MSLDFKRFLEWWLGRFLPKKRLGIISTPSSESNLAHFLLNAAKTGVT